MSVGEKLKDFSKEKLLTSHVRGSAKASSEKQKTKKRKRWEEKEKGCGAPCAQKRGKQMDERGRSETKWAFRFILLPKSSTACTQDTNSPILSE